MAELFGIKVPAIVKNQGMNIMVGAGTGFAIAAVGTWRFQGSPNWILAAVAAAVGGGGAVFVSTSFLGGM
jgi:hypothetical protein